MFLIISVHGALTQIRIRAYPWATANQKKALVTDVTGLLPEGAVRPDLPPHSDNCKRYHTYCSNEDQTGSPVCPSRHTGTGGRGEQHGTLWGPHRFLNVMYVCGGQWGLSGKCDHTWSNWKTLGTRKGGEVRVHSCEVWPKGQLHSAVRVEAGQGHSHTSLDFFQRGSCTFEQNKAYVSILCNPSSYLSTTIVFFLYKCVVKWWVNKQFDFRGMSLFLCAFSKLYKPSH